MKADLSDFAVLLTHLAVSDRAKIIRIDGADISQLSGFGIYPGAVIQIHQKFPSFIIGTDQTELALETDVASRIWVTRLEDPLGAGRGRRRKWRRRGGSRW